MSLLSITLILSSILIAAVSDKRAVVQDREVTSQAQDVARKTVYTLDYILANQERQLKLDYPSNLASNFTINISNNQVRVNTTQGVIKSRTAYSGDQIILNTGSSYELSYNGGVVVE